MARGSRGAAVSAHADTQGNEWSGAQAIR